MPVDVLKIDRSFVERLAAGDAGLIIVEQIETEQQVCQLLAAGCALGQGYLFSPAVDRHAATELLLARAQYIDRRRLIRAAGAS